MRRNLWGSFAALCTDEAISEAVLKPSACCDCLEKDARIAELEAEIEQLRKRKTAGAEP